MGLVQSPASVLCEGSPARPPCTWQLQAWPDHGKGARSPCLLVCPAVRGDEEGNLLGSHSSWC